MATDDSKIEGQHNDGGEARVIKTIIPTTCPHTGQREYICFSQLPPTLNWVLTQRNIDEAKATVLTKIKDLKIDKKHYEQVKEWLKTDEAIFGPDEVDSIIESITSQ